MAINVYWTSLEEAWQRDSAPELVAKQFYKNGLSDANNFLMNTESCPFVNKNFTNLFQIRSLYSYSFKINEDKTVYSKDNDQNFFDKHVLIRSVEKKCFSFIQKRIFFSDSKKELIMNAYIFPYLEQNNITERCIPIPGEFDISKWFRPLEFPFILKEKYNEFLIEEKEVMYYLKFYTEEKIKFIQFYPTEKIKNYYKDCVQTNSHSSKHNQDFFYNNFKLKKLILKEIKENIL